MPDGDTCKARDEGAIRGEECDTMNGMQTAMRFPIRADASGARTRGDGEEREALFRRFADRMVVRGDLNRHLVSYQGNKAQPGLRWLRYKEGFSADLVAGALRFADGPVLDPFAGIGTAALVAGARAAGCRHRNHAGGRAGRAGNLVDRQRDARRQRLNGPRQGCCAPPRGWAERRRTPASAFPMSPSPSAPSPRKPKTPSRGQGVSLACGG